MNKLFLAALLLSASYAQAANPAVLNLKGMGACFEPTAIQIPADLGSRYPQLRAQLYGGLMTRLTAYRVPLVTECDRRLYLQVDAVTNATGALIYSMELAVYAEGLQPELVVVWSLGSFGVATQMGDNVVTVLVDSAGRILDRFAADYARANP